MPIRCRRRIRSSSPGSPRRSEVPLGLLGLGPNKNQTTFLFFSTGKPQREEHPWVFQGLWVSLVLRPLSVGLPVVILCFSAVFSGFRVSVSLGCPGIQSLRFSGPFLSSVASLYVVCVVLYFGDVLDPRGPRKHTFFQSQRKKAHHFI